MTDLTPSVVIYVESGMVKLVQSNIPFRVFLVDYDVTDSESAVLFEYEDDVSEYAYIDQLEAEVDMKAVYEIINLYYDTYGDDDDLVIDDDKEENVIVIRKEEGGTTK